jgi:hypothetical protein
MPYRITHTRSGERCYPTHRSDKNKSCQARPTNLSPPWWLPKQENQNTQLAMEGGRGGFREGEAAGEKGNVRVEETRCRPDGWGKESSTNKWARPNKANVKKSTHALFRNGRVERQIGIAWFIPCLENKSSITVEASCHPAHVPHVMRSLLPLLCCGIAWLLRPPPLPQCIPRRASCPHRSDREWRLAALILSFSSCIPQSLTLLAALWEEHGWVLPP